MDDSPTQADWCRWLECHAPKFLLYARQKSHSEADAQDLVQEAILEARGRTTSHELPSPALVFATIHRRSIDLARSHQRRAARETVVSEAAPTVWFDATIEDRERAALLQEAMNKLPEIYREVITLKVWGELTFAEIASSLQIPQNTAASRFRYALEQLRKSMKEVLI
jgi:RNA polymerase sigma-70 factor (ECF subfamily)